MDVDAASYSEHMKRRYDEIVTRVERACERSGRSLSDVQVMAVSKTVGVDEVLAAMRVGYRLFGENRPQELVRKLDGLAQMEDVPGDVRFDMIGNLPNQQDQYRAGARHVYPFGKLTSPCRGNLFAR